MMSELLHIVGALCMCFAPLSVDCVYQLTPTLYLFYDNLAAGGSLTCAVLSCQVELSKYSTSKFPPPKKHK